MASTPFALQLYTIRDALEADLAGALARVCTAGYTCVELAGTHGHGPEAFKAMLDAAGLTPVSAHIGYPEVTGNPEAVAAQAHTFGIDYVVVPWLGGEAFATRDAWAHAAREMDRAGAVLREAGIRLCYHNHAHEFEVVGGARIFDILFDTTAPENLAIQLDTCWAAVAGVDVPAMIHHYAGRVPLLHIKDYTPGPPPALTELGAGCMPWDAIFEAARACGVAWNIVEQDDNFAADSLASAQAGAAFMASRQA